MASSLVASHSLALPLGTINLPRMSTCMQARNKQVWIWTSNKEVMTASVEGGWNTFIFTPDSRDLINNWSSIARIDPLILDNGRFLTSENKQRGVFCEVHSPHELSDLRATVGQEEIVVMGATDWRVIPAESAIADFSSSKSCIFATSRTAAEAKVFLEALEVGTHGILLKTEDPLEIFLLQSYFASKSQNSVELVNATVNRVELIGMGDRVCVDLCSILKPGEGLLAGSFARTLFLVHSECLETGYVASRPFRVNIGPVHGYIAIPGAKTSYLSELRSGSEVLVVNAQGHSRTAIVGRVKIESRPLVLVEAEVEGRNSNIILQNAETVCLMRTTNEGSGKGSVIPLPVSTLAPGDKILVSPQPEARHTGIKIDEFIIER